MKKIFISLLCALPLIGFGQNILFYNDGAMVKVQAGATLYIQGGMQNTNTGTIDNDGTIDIEGNFVNAGTWEPSQPNTLRFSGTGASDVTSGSAVFQTVEVTKVGNNVNLLDPMTVSTDLNFNSAGATKVALGNFDLKLGSTTTVSGYDGDEFVATSGTGYVQKTVTANGTYEFPIGETTNYTPITCNYTGTAYASANIKARVIDATHPNKPSDAESFISRYWKVNQTGITNYSDSLTATFIPGDLNGTTALIKGATYDGANWAYNGANSGSNIVKGRTGVANADFTGTNFFGKVNVMAFLQGPYQTGSANMTTSLNSGGLIPLSSPYPDAPATVATIPANVTDWVKLELRDISNPATILGTGSAFVKSDGTIVGLDGTSQARIKNGNPSAILAVFHRNHLPFRTDVGVNTVNPVLIDFTTDTTSIYNNNVGNLPLNFQTSRWTMWSCDATGTTFLLNAADVNFIKQQTAVPFTGYNKADVNLNGLGNAADVNIAKAQTAVPKSADL